MESIFDKEKELDDKKEKKTPKPQKKDEEKEVINNTNIPKHGAWRG